MKCNSCGANFKTSDVKCPYCGSVNIVGEEWAKQRKWYEKLFKDSIETFRTQGIWRGLDKILNRILIILAVILFICLALVWIAIQLEGFVKDTNRKWNMDENRKQIEAYHASGDWDELYQLMSDYDMINEEYYIYSQAALLANKYEEYQIYKMQFLDLSEEEKLEDDYYLEYSIRRSYEVYTVDVGIYDDLRRQNESGVQVYRDEITSYWKNTLGMTDAQIESLLEADYLSYDDTEKLVEEIKERKAWQ